MSSPGWKAILCEERQTSRVPIVKAGKKRGFLGNVSSLGKPKEEQEIHQSGNEPYLWQEDAEDPHYQLPSPGGGMGAEVICWPTIQGTSKLRFSTFPALKVHLSIDLLFSALKKPLACRAQ